MTVIAKTTSGGITTPVSAPPAPVLEALFDGTDFIYLRSGDLLSVSPGAQELSLPVNPVTTVLEGSRTVTDAHFGFHAHSYPWTGPAPQVPYGLVRVHDFGPSSGERLRWSHIETSNGTYTWSVMDAVINAYYDAGKEILFMLYGTPDWAVAAAATGTAAYGGKSNQPPDNIADWQDFCTQVATRYAGKIQYYEVWNEPNLTGFYGGAAATVAKLVEMTKVANQAIKAADAAAKIVGPAVTGITSGTGNTYLNSFLSQSDGAGGFGKDWIDYVSIHAYPNNAQSIYLLEAAVAAIRTTMSNNSVSKPLWNTEFGMLSPLLMSQSLEAQKSCIGKLLAWAAATGFERSCWYSWDHATAGLLTPGIEAFYSYVVGVLKSGAITRCRQIRQWTAIRVGGQDYVF